MKEELSGILNLKPDIRDSGSFILVLIAALAYNSASFHLPGNRRGRRINDMGCSRIGLAAGLPTFVLRAHVEFYLRQPSGPTSPTSNILRPRQVFQLKT